MAAAAESNGGKSSFVAGSATYTKFIRGIHPKKPDWYERLYARLLNSGSSDSYNEQVVDYKSELFSSLNGRVRTILEIGVGTGVNFQYLSHIKDVKIIGLDPNCEMKKYAVASASEAGLSDSQFEFIHGVSEGLPLANSSVDAVISTLVLCSVKDVPATLKEICRVLKPGGCLIFEEHVIDKERRWLKFFQKLFDPLQVLISDGCHLARDTLKFIQEAEFAAIDARFVTVSSFCPLLGPHIVGIARKAA